MAQLVLRVSYEAPARTVWQLLRSFRDDAMPDGLMDSYEVQGEGIGAVRTIRWGGGEVFHQTLESIDEQNRVLEIATKTTERLLVRDLRSRVQVREEGAGRCSVEWRLTYEPVGDEQLAHAFLRDVAVTGAEKLRERLRELE